MDLAGAIPQVIPSLPGYGFSGKPSTTGWDPPRIARAWGRGRHGADRRAGASGVALGNITITWLTNTAISGARLYWENELQFFHPMGVTIPIAVSAFPDELYQVPRSWAERAYPKLIHYDTLDKGGHFAAWEQPQLLSEEVRAGFRTLRKS
jgi:hypothetical protein